MDYLWNFPGDLLRTPSARSSFGPGPMGPARKGRNTSGTYYRFLMYDILRRCPTSYIRGPLGIGSGPSELRPERILGRSKAPAQGGPG